MVKLLTLERARNACFLWVSIGPAKPTNFHSSSHRAVSSTLCRDSKKSSMGFGYGEDRLLEDVEHVDCLVLLSALLPSHFLNEAIGLEIVNNFVGGATRDIEILDEVWCCEVRILE